VLTYGHCLSRSLWRRSAAFLRAGSRSLGSRSRWSASHLPMIPPASLAPDLAGAWPMLSVFSGAQPFLFSSLCYQAASPEVYGGSARARVPSTAIWSERLGKTNPDATSSHLLTFPGLMPGVPQRFFRDPGVSRKTRRGYRDGVPSRTIR
jgi:hypothetical protein